MGRKEDPTINTVGKSAADAAKNIIKYENFFSILDDPELAARFLTLPMEECYLNLPNNSGIDSLLNMQTISKNQKKRNVSICILKRI